MSFAPNYTPLNSYADDEANQASGRSTVRTGPLDLEFDTLAEIVNALNANVQLNQRDDNEIRDQRVKLHTLAPDVLKLVTAGPGTLRGAWLTATAYVLKDVVTQGGNTYICGIAHTAGVFAADLAAARWLLLQLGASTPASTVPFVPTATLAATTVQAAIEETDTENRALSAAASAAAAAEAIARAAGDALIRSDLIDVTTVTKGAALPSFNPTLNYAANTIGKSLAGREWLVTDYPWLAKFDGTTDDSAALLACVTALAAAGGGTMLMPKGTAAVSSFAYTYVAGKTVNIRGAGELATKLVKLGATTTPVVELTGPAALYDIFSTFSDFSIHGTTTAPAFRVKNCARFTLRNMTLRDASIGLHNQGSLIFDVIGCTIRNNIVPYKQEKLTSIYCNLITFSGGAWIFNSGIGVLDHGSNITFENVDMEVNGTAGVLTTGVLQINATIAEETSEAFITFSGGWAERNLGTPIIVGNAAGLRLLFRNGFKFQFNEGGRGATIGTINIASFDSVHSADSIIIAAAGLTYVANSNLSNLTDAATTRVYTNSQINGAVVPLKTTTSGLVMQVDNSGNLIGGADIRAAGNISSGNGIAFRSTVNLLDNTGGGAATLTNSPTAGNPTKWIRINDNGTLRYIPTWT